MIELPEAYVLAEQINNTLVGKTIKNAIANAHPHAFAAYTGDPAAYGGILTGKAVTAAYPGPGHTEILCEDMLLVISTPIKYHSPGEKLPKSHQLLLEFDDGSHMSCTVQMWGCMYCFSAEQKAPRDNDPPTPYDDAFDAAYFDGLWRGVKPSISVKAFLATEQRIPGLGNGVLQDILINSRIHPKRKLETLSGEDQERLFRSVKSTLGDMRDRGGRDTEKDLFGNKGGYQTILSRNTLKSPCRICGGKLVREAYLGGNIYYCASCQK